MLFLLLLGCATRAEVHALEARVAALEATATDRVPTYEEQAAANTLMAAANERLTVNDQIGARGQLYEIIARYPGTRAGTAAARIVEELSIVGTPAPTIEVDRWIQGAATFGAGTQLVVFFESWCPHCNNEAPHLQAIENEWGPKGLHVVALTKITKTATEETVRQMIAENAWTFPVGVEKAGSMSTAFKVTGIPAAAIVKDGVITWRGHPARVTEELLAASVPR